jgi:type I restriction enzyme S subunit
MLMSRIDDLINELCPHGVMYKKLCDIGFLYGGLSGKSKNDFQNGNAKYVTYMNIYSNISLDLEISEYVIIEDNEKQNSIQMGDILFTGSSETPDECGISSVVCHEINEPIYLNSFCFGFRPFVDMLIPDFSKHLFRSDVIRNQIGKTANGVTRFNISKKLFNQIEIPVPPLEVQNEIVRILDNFSSLEAELEAELEARKKQYEFFRDKLLDFSNRLIGISRIDRKLTLLCPEGVQYRFLNSVLTIKNGSDYKHLEKGNIPVYGTGGIMTYVDKCSYDKPSVLIPRKGSLSKLYYVEEPFWNVDTIFHTEINTNLVNPKFVFYFLQTQHLESLNTAGGVPSLTQSILNRVLIPVPPLEVQNEIIDILDNFNTYFTSIKNGLPAEIKARRQQYEYYRNKLLTF